MSRSQTASSVPTAAHARFERCFGAHYAAIAGHLAARCATPQDAEDAAIEVFATAWRRIAELPDEPQDKLWLFGVARRVLANQTRARRRAERLSSRLAEQATDGDPAGDVPPVADERIARALDALSDSDRELLTLIAWDELTVAEAGRVLGIPGPLVSRRLYRAKRRFAHVLETARRTMPETPPELPSLAPAPITGSNHYER